MALSAMQVFNQYIMPLAIDTLGQMVEKFNAASGGAIRLTTQNFDGDFLQESFWNGIHAAQRRVDRYAAQGTPAVTSLAQTKKSGVKIAGGFGPILFEPAQLTYIQKASAEAIEVVSRNMAEALLSDQLNTAIAALRAAIANQVSATNDVSPTAGVSYAALNSAHAKFGDRSDRIICHVMTGAVYHKLIGLNLANAQNLFKAEGIQVIDILGRMYVVTDASSLYVSGTPNKNYVLGLVSDAAIVYDGGDVITNIQTTNGKDRIETTFQADYTFGLSLKGYTWDETNGGKSPTDAEIATGSNWDKTATNIKDTAGVVLVADDSK